MTKLLKPEIIPIYSDEGNLAKNTNRTWISYIGIICLTILSILLLKILIESILISLGIFFLVRLALS